ncbi:hypothetical protein GCM10009789_30440 [Kribbella sancticallisti]|uniref:Fucose permease n=1 Tax=Kribbella sancticallisti TaxID=460087 RepID=A0ABN2DCG7_9ACTN
MSEADGAVDVLTQPRRGVSADLLGALSLAGLGFAIAGLGACVALLARDLGESTDQLAVLPSAFAVGLLIVAGIGPLLLRTDAKTPVLRAGAIVCAAGAVLLAVAQNLVVALAGGLFVGLGGALMILVVPLLLSGPRAALRIARVNAVSSTVGIFAPLIIGTLDSLGPTGRLAMLLAAVPLVLLIPLLRSSRELQAQEAQRPLDAARMGGSADAAPASAVSSAGRRPASRREPHHPQPRGGVWVGVFGGWSRVVLAMAVEFCFVIWAVARMVATGLPTGTAALLASAFPIGMAVGRMIGPVRVRGVSPLMPGAVLAGLGTVCVTLFDGPAVVTVGLALAGLGVATFYPIVLADLISIPGVSPAHLASLSACASGVAILLAPAALAALAGVVELRTAFLIPLPLLLVLLLVRRPGSDSDQAETARP